MKIMEDIVVGSFECPVAHLVSEMRKSESFSILFEKWTDIGRELGVDELTIKAIGRDMLVDKLQLPDALAKTLESWIGKDGQNATLGALAQALTANALQSLADSVLKIVPKSETGNCAFSGLEYGVQLPVFDFTGREDTLSEIYKLNNDSSRMTAISGLGGIGKTQLCRMYIERFKKEYQYVLSVTADNRGNIEEAFKNIACDDHLGIPVENKKGDPRPFDEILRDIYKKLKNIKGLLILDNVNSKKDIREILPINFVKLEEARIQVLITSRDSEWTEKLFHVVKLDGLEENEAVEYVNKRLDFQELNEDVEQLVRSLSKKNPNGENRCFPLALRHSVAYIKHTKENTVQNYTIKHYLEEFQKTQKDFLDDDIKFEEEDSYAYTTYTSWKITIDAINNREVNKDLGALSIKIFNMMAFLNPEDIQRKLFYPLVESKNCKVKIRSAVNLLVKYGIVQGENLQETLSVHRLVQTVTRHYLKENAKETCQLTISVLNGIPQEERNLKHVVSVWRYSSNFKEIVAQLYSVSKYKFGLTPLHLVSHGDYNKNAGAAVKLIDNLKLVKNDFREIINEKDDFDRTCLWLAADSGNFEVVKYLLENKANPRIVSNMGKVNPRTNMAALGILGQSPLHRAAFYGFEKCVHLLLKRDRLLFDFKDVKGRTALDMAVFGGASKVVAYLDKKDKASYLFALIRNQRKEKSFEEFKKIVLEANTQEREILMNSKYQNRNLLHEAVVMGHPVSRLEFLIENGINLRPERGSFTAFLYAVYGSHLEAVKHFVSLGAHPTKDTNEDGWTALHAACQHGELEIVKYFISEFPDLDVNVKDPKLDTPLHTACFHGKPEVVEFLLRQQRLYVNVVNRMGITPICSAALTGNFDVVLLILERCAEVKLKPEEVDPGQNFFCSSIGISVAHFAAAYGNLEVLKECKIRGLNVDIGKDKGVSPLHIAVFFNQMESVKYLVKEGADIEAEANVANVIAAAYNLLCNNDTFIWDLKYLQYIAEIINKGRNWIHKSFGITTPISFSQWEGICSEEIREFLEFKRGFQKDKGSQPGPGVILKCILKLKIIQKYIKFVHGFVKQEETIGKEGASIISAFADVSRQSLKQNAFSKAIMAYYLFALFSVSTCAIYMYSM